MKTFSDLLSEYIERIGMSDAELARRLGVSRQTIFRWRDGQIQRPRYRQDVLDLAHKLRLSNEERDQLLVAAGFAPEGASAALGGQKPIQAESGSGRNLRLILHGYWKWALVLLAVLAVGLFAFPERRPACIG